MINRFIARWYELSEGTGVIIIETFMKKWCLEMWLRWGDVLAEQDPTKLRRLSVLLFKNTQTPLQYDGTITAKNWISLGTGQNIRWEVIGCIAAMVGLCMRTLDPSDTLFKEFKVNRTKMSLHMMDVADECVAFCRECETLDDMFLWLLMEKHPLTSTIKGQGSYIAYHQSGELNNAIVAKGLHVNIQADNDTPFFLSELRKRTFIQAYGSECSIASFLGRPPRLSYRYCNINLPLDLDDEQIVMEGAQLQEALASLDSKGWSKKNRVLRTTLMRCWHGFAPRREDIIDLALGNYSTEEVLRHAAEIHEKTEALWASVPLHMQKTRYECSTKGGSAVECLHRNVIRQGTLANELLLQRVLRRKASVPPDTLIATARAIFKDIISITARHDIARDFQLDMTYLLAAHGLRPAAIIAVELLKQEQQVPYPQQPRLPRSETVQDLSVFAARLGAIDRADGTWGLCEQARKVITRILDKLLAPPIAPTATMLPHFPGSSSVLHADLNIAEPNSGLTGLEGLGNGMGLEAPMNLGNDNDFMLWLENTDWDKHFGSPEFL
ncbi:AP-2 complex subunit beta [Venturia nashicola]|nr:AP-2 complex subunit beta [Venturia nashicola]